MSIRNFEPVPSQHNLLELSRLLSGLGINAGAESQFIEALAVAGHVEPGSVGFQELRHAEIIDADGVP